MGYSESKHNFSIICHDFSNLSEFRQVFVAVKRIFVQRNLGIYGYYFVVGGF